MPSCWGQIAVHLQGLAELAQIIESVATVIALVVAGVWSYMLFVKNRIGKPSAITSHDVLVRDLGDRRLLIHVAVTIHNQSAVLANIVTGEVRVSQMLPVVPDLLDRLGRHEPPMCQDTEIEWPCLASRDFDWSASPREIEPHESDTFHFDFLIEERPKTIQVYSYFRNGTKPSREIGWNTTTIHDV